MNSMMLVVFSGALIFLGLCRASDQFPAVPPAGSFLQDYVNVLEPSDRSEIEKLQSETFNHTGIPIVFVSISSMRDYTTDATDTTSFEQFVTRWFNYWGIGNKGTNNGILLLASMQNRKARIELGKGWGIEWNNHAKDIMDNEIVDNFKKQEYSRGIKSAVRELGEMAKAGPQRMPNRKYQSFSYRLTKGGPINSNQLPLIIIAGIALIVLSTFIKQYQKALVISGIGIIVVGVLGSILIMVLFALIALIVVIKGKPVTDSSSGSWKDGGGFGGGSSDGQGGATGTW